jgi:hypothetical protein
MSNTRNAHPLKSFRIGVLLFVAVGAWLSACAPSLEEDVPGDLGLAMSMLDGGPSGSDGGSGAPDAGPDGGSGTPDAGPDGGSGTPDAGSGDGGYYPDPAEADAQCMAYDVPGPNTCGGFRTCDPNNCVGSEPWCCPWSTPDGRVEGPPGPWVCDTFSTSLCEECVCECATFTNDTPGNPAECDMSHFTTKYCGCARLRAVDAGYGGGY